MVDSPAIWYKLKTTANSNENRVENPIAILNNLKTDDSSKIYIIFRKDYNLHFKVFNCSNYFFETSKTIEVAELGVNRVDFAIQRIIYISERLILIKQTYRFDQNALIMYEIKLNKAFPIKTKLIEDLLNNSIDARYDGIVFFGGHNQQLVPHSRIVIYSFMMLKFDEIIARSGPAPEPRFSAFSKLVNNQLIMTGGYSSYSNYYKNAVCKDIWVYDFKTSIWTQTVAPNTFPVSVSLITDKGDNILFLCNTKRMSLNIYNNNKHEFTSIKTSITIEIEKGVI